VFIFVFAGVTPNLYATGLPRMPVAVWVLLGLSAILAFIGGILVTVGVAVSL
jgi:hypothetical protein